MTVQQIIYEAWLNTLKPLKYSTSAADGTPIVKDVNFFDPLDHAGYDPEYRGKCTMCGEETSGGILVKKALGSTYMDWGIHKDPEATHLCRACAFCLLMNAKEGRTALFRFAFVASRKELKLCNRAEMRDMLVSPPDPPFVAIVPTSQKKHLIGKAKVSYSREDFFCNLEEITVPIKRAGFVDLINKIEALRGVGIVKTDIEAGRLSGVFIKNYDITSQEKAIEIINECRRSEMFSLALFVAQKTEEEQARCYLDFRPKMS